MNMQMSELMMSSPQFFHIVFYKIIQNCIYFLLKDVDIRHVLISTYIRANVILQLLSLDIRQVFVNKTNGKLMEICEVMTSSTHFVCIFLAYSYRLF